VTDRVSLRRAQHDYALFPWFEAARWAASAMHYSISMRSITILPVFVLVVLEACSSAPANEPRGAVAENQTASCRPVRRFTFTSSSTTPLGCDQNAGATVLDAVVPVLGRAVGRARFTVRHTGTGDTHFWNARVAVGDGSIAYGIGDDVCPGSTSQRSNIGFGTLAAGARHASVIAYEGSSTCIPGALEIEAGATLEVWVEDPRPACRGLDIAISDHYSASGLTNAYSWQTNMEPIPNVAATLTTTAPSETLRVIGTVEGTPLEDPNRTCGSEAATLVMQTTLDGDLMATTTDPVPASQGMGHLVLATSGDQNELRSVTPGEHSAAIMVGANFTGPVTTGGCCGDGTVVLIRER
jgi:hypothetical protein